MLKVPTQGIKEKGKRKRESQRDEKRSKNSIFSEIVKKDELILAITWHFAYNIAIVDGS